MCLYSRLLSFVGNRSCSNSITSNIRRYDTVSFSLHSSGLTTRNFSDSKKLSTMDKRRVLSIQSHVVHGYAGNKSATFPLQV